MIEVGQVWRAKIGDDRLTIAAKISGRHKDSWVVRFEDGAQATYESDEIMERYVLSETLDDE